MMIPDREGGDSRPNPNLLMQFLKRLGQVNSFPCFYFHLHEHIFSDVFLHDLN